LKLLDTLYGLLAFIARAIGEPGDGSSSEAVAVLPKRSNEATIPFSLRDRGFESFSLQRRAISKLGSDVRTWDLDRVTVCP
jgi:hypothetical protein